MLSAPSALRLPPRIAAVSPFAAPVGIIPELLSAPPIIMSLPPEVRAKYVTIIDDILADSDLNLISEKRIRKGIQQHVEYDITPQKVRGVLPHFTA